MLVYASSFFHVLGGLTVVDSTRDNQINALRATFNKLNSDEKKQFVQKLETKLKNSNNPTYTNFLNECKSNLDSSISESHNNPLCPKCEKMLPDDTWVYCPACGTDVKNKNDETAKADIKHTNVAKVGRNSSTLSKKHLPKIAIVLVAFILVSSLGVGGVLFWRNSNSDETLTASGSDGILDSNVLPVIGDAPRFIANPEEPITRGEFVRLIVQALEFPTDVYEFFNDVPLNHELNVWVTSAVQRSIFILYEHGENLGVYDSITNEEAVSRMLRALGVSIVNQNEIDTAVDIGLITETSNAALNPLDTATNEQALEFSLNFERVLESLMPSNEEVFQMVYRSDISVISQPPMYSLADLTSHFFIIIDHFCNEIANLVVGDMFILEPTENNPDGFVGRISSISVQNDNSINITATPPDSLDEVFYDFEFTSEIDLFGDGFELIILDDYNAPSLIASTPQVGLMSHTPQQLAFGGNIAEIRRHSNISVQQHPGSISVGIHNHYQNGIRFDGSLSLILPRLNVSATRQGADVFVTTGARVNIESSSQFGGDTIIPLFDVIIRPVIGIRFDVPVGLRVTSRGEYSLEFLWGIDAQFGIINGRYTARTNVTFDFDFTPNAEMTLSVIIQAQFRILGINIYGVYGDFGRGLNSDNVLQSRCPTNECLVIGFFDVRRVGSLRDWGLFGNFSFLQFSHDFAPDRRLTFRYRTDGRWARVCPHINAIPPVLQEHITDSHADNHMASTSPSDGFQETPGMDLPGLQPPPNYAPSHPNMGGTPTASFSLEEIQNRSGIYIKRNNRFYQIPGGWLDSTFRDVNYSSDFRARPPNTRVVVRLSDAEILQLYPTDQLVYVGGRPRIFELEIQGFTAGIQPFSRRSRGSWDIGGEVVGYPGAWATGVWYTRMNDVVIDHIPDISNYFFAVPDSRVGSRNLQGLSHADYILNGAYGQVFTFGRFSGTTWHETTYVANLEFYRISELASFTETTRHGYFYLDFERIPGSLVSIVSPPYWGWYVDHPFSHHVIEIPGGERRIPQPHTAPIEAMPTNSEPDHNGVVWVIQPTLQNAEIWYCPYCDVFADWVSGRIVNRQTGQLTSDEKLGHGGSHRYRWVFDRERQLFGHGGVDDWYSWMFSSIQMFPFEELAVRFPVLSNRLFSVEAVDSSVRTFGGVEGETEITEILAEAAYTGRFAIINNGELVTDFIFFDRGSYWDNETIAMKTDMWGIVDNRGNIVVPFIFNNILHIDSTAAFANYNGQYGIVHIQQTAEAQ